ncbi:MAG: N-acetylglucosamine-6-phosphate deacetylase [Boseongicola sp. SB0677_bin_26]|nr:N-acetylglucosamine-6-phosphate deacetylase [Boseongicola sp. SB0665_bin_10]MYG27568.1 N-acetylglucosamine-6-phosphate deacetylase [Boseongicola sp. SB0677_bin_26]
MTQTVVTFRNGRIFDGRKLRAGHAIRFVDGHAREFGPDAEVPRDGEVVDLSGDILTPGYVDLQVNGGGGVMLNNDPSVETLRRIAGAHRNLGVATLLPTLISDSAEKTRATIEATIEAVQEGVPGIAGLHLEGPHLSIARKGAHDPAFIRPMEDDDLHTLVTASRNLPVLKVTVAPESVTEEQVSTLARAGALVSLGHSDASLEVCMRYFAAGARCVTHMFNAMSQLGNREPGLVGAALASGGVSASLIADAVHVHPETIRTAWAAKAGPGRVFLVSDAMAVAGTDLTEFELGGRLIRRRDGALRLQDGTLAGADLELTFAINILVENANVSLESALQAAISHPAALIGVPGAMADANLRRLSELRRVSSDLTSSVAVH